MNIYLGDLHLHTNYSDGDSSPEQLVLKARNAGFDFIAITDNNQYDANKYAKSVVEKYVLGLVVIPGEEITADWGHLLAYNIKQYVQPDMSPEDICKTVHLQGGYIFAAHPFLKDIKKKFWDSGLFESLLANKQIDGFEMINTESTAYEDNIQLINKYREFCMRNDTYPVIGGSDARKQDQLGRNIRIYVLAESLTEENIVRSIVERKCVIEWQRHYYGNNEYVSDVDLWYSENFIDHLRQCQQEVAPFI